MASPMSSKVTDTINRRNASRDWLRDNYWNEWEEVWRFFKCRVEAMVDPQTGKEDETRTNLCMPDIWIAGRKKAARMSRRPPSIRVRSSNPELSEKLSAWTAYQWDRTDEQRFQRRHVLQAALFGLSLKEHSYDEVVMSYRFRRSTEGLLREAGVIVNEDDTGLNYAIPNGSEGPDDQGAGKIYPFNSFDSSRQAEILAQFPPDTFANQKVVKYEGPVSNWVFIGDYYPEPEFTNIHEASYNIIEQIKDLTWLAYWANRTFKDPDTGKEYPVFDKAAVQELADMPSYNPSASSNTHNDLKDRLLSVLNKERPTSALTTQPTKRFRITKEYTLKSGWPHIRFIGNDKILLTPTDVPLPWDLYGHYPLSGFVPIPDLLFGIGDASPRILRHLVKLHNVTANLRTDYLVQTLKPLALVREGSDIPGEIIDRGLLRVLKVRNPGDYQIERLPQVPPEAFQAEAAVLRMIQMGEPSLIDFGQSSQAVASSQRVATLGVLQAKSQETLSADELDALNESLGAETQIKLWMLQQSMNEPMSFELPRAAAAYGLTAASSDGVRKIELDPFEIQEDFEVFPEFASTLGLDDQDRQQRAMEIWSMAEQAPQVFNIYEAARRVAVASGITNPEALVRPEPPAPPPLPPMRINFSFTDKWTDLEPDLKAQLLSMMGIAPSADTQDKAHWKALNNMLDISKKSLDLSMFAKELTGNNPPGRFGGDPTGGGEGDWGNDQ